MSKVPKLLQSSADSSKLSLTIKGILLALAPLIITLLASVGVNIAETDYMQAVELITAIVAASMTLVGLLRKLYNFLKARYSRK